MSGCRYDSIVKSDGEPYEYDVQYGNKDEPNTIVDIIMLLTAS
jgi:hypothetical protein